MQIDDYIVDGIVARDKIAFDIKRRNLKRSEIEQIAADNRIKSSFLDASFSKKVPKEQWTKEYLDELSWIAIAECFNLDYMLYLDEVADFVTKAKFKKIVVGTVVVVLVIIAGIVVLSYIL